MKKINWKPKNSKTYAKAVVGSIIMYCNMKYPYGGDRYTWFADVSIQEVSHTVRYGPLRKSINQAKEDAIKIACEMLLDYKECLKIEMANFDLVE